jgi:superfamily II DNA or RNA helicase
MHGIVTTYQQVATSSGPLREAARDAFVVFDEIHHAADDRAWGDAVREAFELSVRRLAISGTPFRSDTRSIPFVRYVLDEAAPDFEYGYGDALGDGRVVRPVYFPRTGGHMEWSAPDGSLQEASFDDALDQARSSQRLRTALSVEGEWLPTVLREAVERLDSIRAVHPTAGGLVIAIDQDHARGIASLLRARFGQQATVVTSDDPDASGKIARFAASSEPWLVAVRMVSEGVDIPRLRVGVYATTTTTELFFRQAVGRFVRWTHGVKDQKAFLYIPDDPKLRSRAFQIADQRRHSLRKREQERVERDPAALDAGAEEQLSLFAALSAVATEHEVHDPFAAEVTDDDALPDDDPGLEVVLAPPPPLAGDRRPLDELGVDLGGAAGRTRREEKRRLREQNAEIVAALVQRTGQSHAQVNAELNRLSGVGRITEATVGQLRRRLEVGEKLARR